MDQSKKLEMQLENCRYEWFCEQLSGVITNIDDSRLCPSICCCGVE